MSINIDFEDLTSDQQDKVQEAYEGNCAGCAIYLGKTHAGEHTYFWHYGASEGYTVLPVAKELPGFDYETGSIWIDDREFSTADGKEIPPPAFTYLIHVDLRKWDARYAERMAVGGFASKQEEDNFLLACGGGSTLPKRAAEKVGKTPAYSLPWAANLYVAPWELTQELLAAAVAVTLVRPNGDRIAVI